MYRQRHACQTVAQRYPGARGIRPLRRVPVAGWEPVSMTDFPCLVRLVARSGEARYRLGHPLVDRYLEFVAGDQALWIGRFR